LNSRYSKGNALAFDVSVIIPTHGGRSEATHRAARSAIVQKNVSVEIIIVDDASSPPYELPLDLSRLENVRVIRNTVNGGAAAARNTGIKHASGRWIAFLDSDDEWRSGKLSRQLASVAVADREELNIIVSGFSIKSHVAESKGSAVEKAFVPVSARNASDFASGCWFCPGSTAVIDRKTFDVVGLFDEKLRRLEDLDWYLRFGLSGGFLIVTPEVLADINVGKRPSLRIVRQATDYMRSKYSSASERSWFRKLEAYLYLEEAAASWNEGKKLSMIGYLLHSFWRAPRLRLHLRKYLIRVS